MIIDLLRTVSIRFHLQISPSLSRSHSTDDWQRSNQSQPFDIRSELRFGLIQGHEKELELGVEKKIMSDLLGTETKQHYC